MKIQLIAEIGSIHDGSFGNAKKLIELAAQCKATDVKFQTHIAEAETLKNAPSPTYFKDESRFAYFQRTSFNLNQWKELKRHAEGCGLGFLSSPFSLESVDLLEEVGIQSYKIPSGEVTNIPLLEKVALTKKPVFLSSGMSDWKEVDNAVDVLKKNCAVTVLQCSSQYPCPPERVGLNVIREIMARYNLPVGFSDHTRTNTAAIAAAALGAEAIEKHLTFSNFMYGSDAKNATEPAQFLELALALKEIETMMNSPVNKDDLGRYRDMKSVFEKSIVTLHPIKKGQILKLEDLTFKKPGDGVSAAKYKEIVGRKTKRDLPEDHKISLEDLE